MSISVVCVAHGHHIGQHSHPGVREKSLKRINGQINKYPWEKAHLNVSDHLALTKGTSELLHGVRQVRLSWESGCPEFEFQIYCI